MGSRFSNLEFNEDRGEERFDDGGPPGPPDPARLLADAVDADRWGEHEKALRLFTRCLELDRTVVPAWVGQVQMLIHLAEFHEARVWSDKALELFRGNGELLAAKAQAAIRLLDERTAWSSIDGALQAPGSSPYRWQVRGEVLLSSRGRFYEECFRKSLAEPAASWFDRVAIARIYAFHDQAANALRYLREALEMEPSHGYIWFERGNCELALGFVGAAKKSWRRCLELRPRYRPAMQAIERRPPSILERAWKTWKRWRGR
jgi:tetratricopeptide (TPR) repeat protein